MEHEFSGVAVRELQDVSFGGAHGDDVGLGAGGHAGSCRVDAEHIGMEMKAGGNVVLD